MEVVDFYWSFRSHYCYLAIDRVLALPKTYDVQVRLRPVYPLAIRTPDFFSSIPRGQTNRWAYIVRDAERIAERLQLPFAWPDPDPIVMDMQSLQISDEQPHIFRLTRLGVAACRRGQGLEFTAGVSRLIFGGTRDWDSAAHLADEATAVGLDLEEMDAAIAANPEDYDAEIRRNEAALAEAGHWGVPTLVFRDEPFFGQDRIDDIKWRLKQKGLGR